jgi:hypothetical protein
MKNRLLVFGRLSHDPQRILATVGQFALMGIERGFNFLLRLGLELRVAAFAYSDYRWVLFYDPQLALWHDLSLAHGRDECNAREFQTAPLPLYFDTVRLSWTWLTEIHPRIGGVSAKLLFSARRNTSG